MTKKKLPPEYKIGIIGSGKMGRDIFDFLCAFPFQVCLLCETIAELEFQSAAVKKKQNRALKYGMVDEETSHFQREHSLITSDLKNLSNCELIIEAITEDFNKKRKLFLELDQIVSSNCIITSNTSSISPDNLFDGLQHSENCMGLHFFFPVAMKDWVEINLPENINERSISFVHGFIKRIGKKHLILKQENHFIINRIFLKTQAICCQMLIEGRQTVEEIDNLVKFHLFPIGVFEFFDHVGIDVMLQSVLSYVQFERNTEYFQPMIDLLTEKQKLGKLGLKTKAGFYDYPTIKNEMKSGETEESLKILKEITCAYLGGVFDVLNYSTCNRQELEQIIMNYMMIEKSPFDLAKEVGYTSK